MEPNLSFLASRPVAPGTTEPSAAAAAPVQGPGHLEKSDFAQVLSGQTLKAQRQHLAALEAPGQGLQVVPLGNKINVITSDAPLPDMASLAQFARLQGLDEAAVQALFGAATAAKVHSVTQSAAVADALTASLAVAEAMGVAPAAVVPNIGGLPLPQTNLVDPVAPATAPAPSLTVGTPSADSLQALLASPAAQALQVKVAALSVSQNEQVLPAPATAVPAIQLAPAPAGATLPSAAAPLPPLVNTKPAPTPLPPVMALASPSLPLEPINALPVAAPLATATVQSSLLPLQAKAWTGKAEVAPIDAADPTPTMAPEDAIRLTLAMPAPEITKRLAQMSGTGKETTWAALLASGPASKDQAAATDTVTLDLPAGFDADLLAPSSDTGLSKPSEVSTQAGVGAPVGAAVNAAGAQSGSNPGNAQAQADHRAQQFQQLADQMGQAAAQRLMAQIERGQWKMQMRMQPASLGSINVELDMHAGGLDALFSTDNAVTRDLMAQGSNKLRDTLIQSGMTVASVSVNGEQSRQSGGNSTPGKGRGTPFANPAASVLASAAVAPAQVGQASENDGLNLLA